MAYKKTKNPRLYGRMKLTPYNWERDNLAEYTQIAQTLGRKAKKSLLQEVDRLQDCARAFWARQSGAGCSFRCGLRGCLKCRRKLSEARFERLAALLPSIPTRSIAVASAAAHALLPDIANAEVSARHNALSPIAARQQQHLANLHLLHAELQAAERFEWYFVTVKLPYDPRASNDLTVTAIRQRAKMCQGIEVHIHKHLFAPEVRPSLAWVAIIECGQHGLVHLHVMFRGPSRRLTEIRTVVRQTAADADVTLSKVPNEEVPRSLRYITKPDNMKADTWHSFKRGRCCKVPHPELDARFTEATRGLHTRTNRGLFRKGKP
jgi:hypothetical protein